MTLLIAGLLIFLGTHSIGIVANDWRTSQRQRIGDMPWKGAYALASLIGFALIIWGFSIARLEPVVLWTPPIAMRHIAALLTLIAFILLAATYIPRNGIKAKVHHPMTLGVTVWAFAHLLANGRLVDLILFGSFLVWAKVSFITSRKRDRATGAQRPNASFRGTVTTIFVGVAAWVLFAFWLHSALIGVRPFAFSL
jgi:uncharacterized membrane protein